MLYTPETAQFNKTRVKVAKTDIVGRDVGEIGMPRPLLSGAFTLEKPNTHQHTDQVDGDQNQGSSKGKRSDARPGYWCKREDLNLNRFSSSQC